MHLIPTTNSLRFTLVIKSRSTHSNGVEGGKTWLCSPSRGSNSLPAWDPAQATGAAAAGPSDALTAHTSNSPPAWPASCRRANASWQHPSPNQRAKLLEGAAPPATTAIIPRSRSGQAGGDKEIGRKREREIGEGSRAWRGLRPPAGTSSDTPRLTWPLPLRRRAGGDSQRGRELGFGVAARGVGV
jgi:hypothetical protein